MNENEFTAMVCSKILHDLAGPIGAIMNGTELLKEGGGSASKEILDLLKSSSDQLTALLQVFRVGFGALSTGGEEVEAEMVREHLATFARFKGVEIHWLPEEAMIDKDIAKIIVNSAFILVEAARKKGQLQISCSGAEGRHSFSVAAFGEGIKAPEELRLFFTGAEIPELSTRNIPAYLIAQLAVARALKITLVETANGPVLQGKTKG